MRYDFDTLTDRRGTGACKWDRRTDEEKQLGVVPMSVADMEFQVAPCVRAAVIAAAHKGLYGYTDPDARYFEAVAGWLSARHGLALERGDIFCSHGVVPALSAAVRAFSEPGDGVIIQTPVYYPFSEVITQNGRAIMENPLINRDGRYEMDFAGLEELALKPEAKLLLLCNPHNPVGRVWTPDELTRVAAICADNGVTLISDEIHFDIVLEGEHCPILAVPRGRGISVTLTSASKTFNLPGLQLANIIAVEPNLRATLRARLRADGYSNISYFGYAATIAAYEGGADWADALLEKLRENSRKFDDFLAQTLPEARVTPLEGTYLKWVDFRYLGLEPRALEALTRGKARQILDEGYIFGPEGEGFERFNIALPTDLMLKNLRTLASALTSI